MFAKKQQLMHILVLHTLISTSHFNNQKKN
jgi:hypothetical protein